MKRRIWHWLAVALCPVCAAVFVAVAMVQSYLPAAFTTEEGEPLVLQTAALRVSVPGAAAVQGGQVTSYTAQIKLFGIVPAQKVAVKVNSHRDVAVCGVPFGIRMFTQGVLVVGIGQVDTRHGAKSPAEEAGLRVGDSILKIDGREIDSTEDVAAMVEASAGRSLTLTVSRQQTVFEATLVPVASVAEQCLKAGMWIRDSAAGIGTLTFYDMNNGVFAGLGHPIHDADTGQTVPISSGEIVPASVFGVNKGEAGVPGELLGSFEDGSWGLLTTNDETGLYGLLHEQPPAFSTLPVAHKQEVTTGAAQLITTVSGREPQSYAIEIERVDYREDLPTQNMVIRITDDALLQATGGVLCGMSGSPILQNGKLVGAVTHVFVGDPTGGYAIFAENMLSTAQTVPSSQQQDAA